MGRAVVVVISIVFGCEYRDNARFLRTIKLSPVRMVVLSLSTMVGSVEVVVVVVVGKSFEVITSVGVDGIIGEDICGDGIFGNP